MEQNSTLKEELCFEIDANNLAIRADQVRARLKMFPTMVGSQALIEPLTVALLWNHAPHGGLILWLLILTALHTAEMWMWWKFNATTNTIKDCIDWSVRFKFFALAVGVAWGCAAICFFPAELAIQSFFICVLLGLASGAVTMNPVYPPALYLYLGPLLIPSIARIAYEGDGLHWTIAGMLTLFTLVVLHSGRQLGKTFFTSLSQRHENLQLVEQMAKAKALAETASREKSRFLAAASHDLRQPLQALMLFSDAMQEQTQEKETKHLSVQIGKSVNALVEMFDELLDVSRLEAGIVEARLQNFELQHLLDRLYVDLAPLAQIKGLSFDMPSGDGVVYSDPFLLDRILRNLISNAIRYTDQGGVTIRYTAQADGYHFAVIDTGIGIRAEVLPHIFEEYYQVDNQHRDRRKGLGLGLAIVRRVEGLLGCKIEVKSEPEKGSEFSFVVPRGNAEKLAQPFVITHSRYDLRGVVVALVEDDPDIRQLLAELMGDWGCHVFDGENGEDVMRKIDVKGKRPDILVSDYRLPQGVTAIQVIKRVHELWGEGVPALVLTGDTAPETLQNIHTSGAMLLHKPIAPTRLRTMMYFTLHGEK